MRSKTFQGEGDMRAYISQLVEMTGKLIVILFWEACDLVTAGQ